MNQIIKKTYKNFNIYNLLNIYNKKIFFIIFKKKMLLYINNKS